MFRLEPGPIFTRCGNSQRLDDGRIGIPGASDDHALFGDLKIPDVFSDISVNDSGKMTVTCADGATSEVGIIQLARVRGDTELDTRNGVYFWPQEASAPGFTMEPATNVVVAALENSNVVARETTELLRNLKLISEVFSFREN